MQKGLLELVVLFIFLIVLTAILLQTSRKMFPGILITCSFATVYTNQPDWFNKIEKNVEIEKFDFFYSLKKGLQPKNENKSNQKKQMKTWTQKKSPSIDNLG